MTPLGKSRNRGKKFRGISAFQLVARNGGECGTGSVWSDDDDDEQVCNSLPLSENRKKKFVVDVAYSADFCGGFR